MWRHKSSPRGVDRFIINQGKKTNATHTTTSLIPALFPKFSTVTFSAVCSGGVRVNDLPLLNMKVRLSTYSFYYTVWLTGLCQLESMRSEVMQITFNCENSIVFNA